MIAKQLFPRLTVGQQQALIERQDRRRIYLLSYQALQASLTNTTTLNAQVNQFLNQPELPFSSIQRSRSLKELKDKELVFLNDPTKLQAFSQKILDDCRPTYFNLMKVMYPLLADVYELNEAVYQKATPSKNPGFYIGNYTHPLNESLSKAKQKFSKGSMMYELAIHLENEIKKIKNPGSFGHYK